MLERTITNGHSLTVSHVHRRNESKFEVTSVCFICNSSKVLHIWWRLPVSWSSWRLLRMYTESIIYNTQPMKSQYVYAHCLTEWRKMNVQSCVALKSNQSGYHYRGLLFSLHCLCALLWRREFLVTGWSAIESDQLIFAKKCVIGICWSMAFIPDQKK